MRLVRDLRDGALLLQQSDGGDRPYDDVPMPPGCRVFDFEVEVAAIIGPLTSGQPLSDLTVEAAADCIVGYTLFNDWSARDLQIGPSRSWSLTPRAAPGCSVATCSGPAPVATAAWPNVGAARAGKPRRHSRRAKS
jgi:2-keto-4-pentenoate hydratase/2-oxohepta-3-ene-1,7-dioic acid hydratase in catechol pathway